MSRNKEIRKDKGIYKRIEVFYTATHYLIGG
jgi:hypothetical protein